MATCKYPGCNCGNAKHAPKKKREKMERAAANAAQDVLEAGGTHEEMSEAAVNAAWYILEAGR